MAVSLPTAAMAELCELAFRQVLGGSRPLSDRKEIAATGRSWPTRASEISSAIRSAVPGAGQEAEIDLSPQVADEPYPSRSARRHSDRRR